MSFEFKQPWIAVGGFADNLVHELQREVTEKHLLWNTTVQAIAQRIDSDEVLFFIQHADENPHYALVHLTWSGEPEHDPRWPDTVKYSSLEQWAQVRMMPDHAEFSAG